MLTPTSKKRLLTPEKISELFFQYIQITYLLHSINVTFAKLNFRSMSKPNEKNAWTYLNNGWLN